MVNYTGAFLVLLAGVTQSIGRVCGLHCSERRYAYDYSSSSSYYYYVQCTSGCCSYQYIYYCCNATSNLLSDEEIGVIVGATIGGIFFLGIIITVFSVFCACYICKCKCKNETRINGVLVHPSTNDTNTVGMSNLTKTVQTESYSQQHNQPPSPSYPELPNVPSQAFPTLPPPDVLRNI